MLARRKAMAQAVGGVGRCGVQSSRCRVLNSDIAAHTVYTHAYYHVLRRLLSRYLQYETVIDLSIRSLMIPFLDTVDESSQIRVNFHHMFGNPSGCGICHS